MKGLKEENVVNEESEVKEVSEEKGLSAVNEVKEPSEVNEVSDPKELSVPSEVNVVNEELVENKMRGMIVSFEVRGRLQLKKLNPMKGTSELLAEVVKPLQPLKLRSPLVQWDIEASHCLI